MRVYYLNHDLKDKTGAGRFGLAILNAIKNQKSDLDFSVLTSEASGHEKERPIIYSNKLRLLFVFLKIRKEFKKCDVIHALDGWPYGFIAAFASLGLKKKLIITAIGTGAVQPLYSWWKRPLIKWAYKKADVVTAISSNTKREILKIMPNLNIEVINHGVDYEKFVSDSKNPNTFESFELNANISNRVSKPYILSVGTLKKRKGFEYSIRAFAEIAPRFPDLKYVIVGKGPEEGNLKSEIEKLGINSRVIFLSGLSEEELISLYKNAELFILLPQDDNKDIEGFGLVFLEAAACVLPVVATKNTSAEDAVLDGKNGLLVKPRDFTEAAAAMEKILSDENLKDRFSQRSLKFAKSMSWEKAAASYLRLY